MPNLPREQPTQPKDQPHLAPTVDVDDERRRIGRLLALVLVLAALLRFGYLLEVSTAPDFASPRFEALYHESWARSLLSDDWTPPPGVTDPEIPHRPYFRPPGYPFFLAGIHALSGGSYLAPRWAQMLLGLASVYLLFALVRRFFGPLAGVAGAGLYGLAWVPIFFEAELMAPSLLLALLLTHLLLLALWRERLGKSRSSFWALSAGASLGAASLVRPNTLALALPVLLWMAWLLRRRQIPRRRWPRPLLAFLVALGLAVAPATWRNYRVSGELVLITSNAGINLFVGMHPQSDGHTPGIPELGELLGLEGWDSFDQPKIVAAVSAREGRAMSDSEVSRWLTRRALEHAKNDPWGVLRQVGRKLLLFWGPVEISNNKVLELERRHSPTLGLGLGFATLFALALAGLGCQVLSRSGRNSSSERCQVVVGNERGGAGGAPASAVTETPYEGTVLFLAVIVTTCVAYLPFFVSARFRVPVVPLLAAFGGVALAALWRLVVAARWRPLVGGLALLALFRLLTGIAWIPYEPDEALWHLRRGLLLREQGRFDEAANSFGQTLGVDPHHPEAPLLLGEALTAAERPAEAAAVYRRILVENPRSIEAHNNLALLLAQAGRLDDAIGHWRTVLEIDPERVPALVNLATALANHPEPTRREPARALARRAAELHPDDPKIEALLRTLRRSSETYPEPDP